MEGTSGFKIKEQRIEMNKTKVVLIVLQGLIFLIGYYLMDDIKISIGVLMLIWANSMNDFVFSNKRGRII